MVKGNTSELVNRIIGSFNTWSFKREQPSNVALLEKAVSFWVNQNTPISFILYWGKGDRNECGEVEKQALEFLQEMATRITIAYKPGVHFEFLFTDTHAKLNGYSKNEIESYFPIVVAHLLHVFITAGHQ